MKKLTIQEKEKYYCGDSIIDIHYPNKLERPIISIIQRSNKYIECFYIPFKYEDFTIEKEGVYGYYISMYKPEYAIDTKNKLTQEMKEQLMDILINDNGWNALINSFNVECNNSQPFEYCKECKHKFRKFSKEPPNYLLLPE